MAQVRFMWRERESGKEKVMSVERNKEHTWSKSWWKNDCFNTWLLPLNKNCDHIQIPGCGVTFKDEWQRQRKGGERKVSIELWCVWRAIGLAAHYQWAHVGPSHFRLPFASSLKTVQQAWERAVMALLWNYSGTVWSKEQADWKACFAECYCRSISMGTNTHLSWATVNSADREVDRCYRWVDRNKFLETLHHCLFIYHKVSDSEQFAEGDAVLSAHSKGDHNVGLCSATTRRD